MTTHYRQTFAEDGASASEDMNAEECSIVAFEAKRGRKRPSGVSLKMDAGTEKFDDKFDKF